MVWDYSGSGLFCYVLHLALKHPEAPPQVGSLYWVALRKISEKELLNYATACHCNMFCLFPFTSIFHLDSRERRSQRKTHQPERSLTLDSQFG